VRYAPYLFISPFYILFAIFGLFPIIFSFVLSFHTWRAVGGLSTMHWVGIRNYYLLLTDPWFWQALINTLILLVFSGFSQHLIALPLAYIIDRHLPVKLQNFFSASYFLPYLTSSVAIALIFSTIYGYHYGILNELLNYLATAHWSSWAFGWLKGALPINWLGKTVYIKPSIIIVVVWRWFGWNTVLYLAGLQTISKELYDAAKVDGANAWHEFWNISLPLLRPIIFFAVTMTIIGNMQLFDEPYVLTNGTGGIGRAGMTVAIYLYRTAFEWTQMGVAAAMSWLLAIFIGILSVANYFLFAKKSLNPKGNR
jgi:multiple sugar transport system permease protein